MLVYTRTACVVVLLIANAVSRVLLFYYLYVKVKNNNKIRQYHAAVGRLQQHLMHPVHLAHHVLVTYLCQRRQYAVQPHVLT